MGATNISNDRTLNMIGNGSGNTKSDSADVPLICCPVIRGQAQRCATLQLAIQTDQEPVQVNRNSKPLDLDSAIAKFIDELIEKDDSDNNDEVKHDNAKQLVHTNMKANIDKQILRNVNQMRM